MRIGAGVLLLLFVVWAVRLLFPTEAERIRRQLDALGEAASFEAGEVGLARVARAVGIGRYFATDVVIDLGEPFGMIEGREAVVAMAARIPVGSEDVTIQFVDAGIIVLPDEGSATVRVTVQGTGLDLAGRDVIDACEIDIRFQQIEGDWLIARVDGVQVIQRPGTRREYRQRRRIRRVDGRRRGLDGRGVLAVRGAGMNVTVGTTAPDFELDSHQEGKVRLSGFQGKKHVVIAFHPLAWTPV